jgi:putative membrane protein
MTRDNRNKPKAWRFDDPDVAIGAGKEGAGQSENGPRARHVHIEPEPEAIMEAADGSAIPMGRRRRIPWGSLFLGSVFALLMLGLTLWAERLVRDLFALAPWLGWVGLALALIALAAFIALLGRELSGLWRERRIEHLREQASRALADDDPDAARLVTVQLVALYARRPGTARGRAEVERVAEAILEARDRLVIAERALLAEHDRRARREIAQLAKRVSVVTAVSPRAIIDIAFVLYAAARLLGRISTIYGGRPGLVGFLRLARAAINHLAVTGGIAMGDDLLQQVVGHGLAARLSTKLGEGVLNGAMTARFGLAAIAVCRPLPFIAQPAPKFSDVAGDLFTRAREAAREGEGGSDGLRR